jgi:hypothetical protein
VFWEAAVPSMGIGVFYLILIPLIFGLVHT